MEAAPPVECEVDCAPVPRKVTRPRADALRNRERIVTATRELIVEFGPEVALDEIARRAGVGNATVYRNFPDRDTLVREVVRSVIDRTMEAAESALTRTGDAFEALERFAHTAVDERICALCPVTTGVFGPHDPELTAARERLEGIVELLIDRAQKAGRLRADVGPGDVIVAVVQLSRPPAGIGCRTLDRFVHRNLQLYLDGLRVPGRSALPGAAVHLDDLRRP